MFTVGEYWHHHAPALTGYLDAVNNAASLFDVPLHQHFHQISREMANTTCASSLRIRWWFADPPRRLPFCG